MDDSKVDPSEEVSQWLREVGRRRWPRSARPGIGAEVPTPPRKADGGPVLRRTLLLILLLIVSLHYIYADTTLKILSLPELLVFVFTG